MKKNYLFLIMLFIAITSCSKSENADEPKEPVKIVLTGDKTSIKADGKESIRFYLYDNNGKEITSLAKIKVNGKEINGFSFSTSEAGDYTASASYEDAISNEINFLAIGKKLKLEIHASKTKLVSDDTDMTYLSLYNSKGVDVTGEAKFYVNNKEISGRYLKISEEGIYNITSKLKDVMVEGKLTISGHKKLLFDDRIIAEDFTGTWCGNCAGIIKNLEPIIKKDNRVIMIGVHYEKVDNMKHLITEESLKDNRELAKLLGKGSGYPALYINRIKQDVSGRVEFNATNYITGHINQLGSEIGIAIETKIVNKKAFVKAFIKSQKESFQGKIVAVVVENGLKGEQAGLGEVHMLNVMRKYVPNVHGSDISVEAGKVVEFSEATVLNEICKLENCTYIVFIIDDSGEVVAAQQCKLGYNIGY